MDGRRIKPLLEGKEESWPDRMFYTHGERQANPESMDPGFVRSRRFNLVSGAE